MKKLVTLMLSVMLLMTAMITSVAADNITPINPSSENMYLIEIDQADATIVGETSYEFLAYRIFKGTPSKLGTTKILSDIEWDETTIKVAELKADLMQTFPAQFPSSMAGASAAEFASKMNEVSRIELLSTVIARNVKENTGTRIAHLHEYTSTNHSGWTIVADLNEPHTINWELSTVPVGTNTEIYNKISDLSDPLTWVRGEHVGYKSYVEAGYYLIVNDKTPASKAGSRYILDIVDNLKISPKPMSDPTFNKQVVRQNDSTDAKLEPYKNTDTVSIEQLMTRYPNWYATADYDIGDDVVYRLSVSLPDQTTLNTITEYRIEVYDDMSEGLTFNNDSLLMYYGYSEGTTYHYTQVNVRQIVSKEKYDVVKASVNNSVTQEFIEEMETVYPQKYKKVDSIHKYLSCTNTHTHEDNCWETITVGTTVVSDAMAKEYAESHVWYNTQGSSVYTSGTELTIGCDAINYMVSKIGEIPAGITGHFHIFYSATLNDSAKVGVDATNSNGNPNKAYLKFSQPTGFNGKSPEHINEVYTYKLSIDKKDENNNALAGADFELLKYYKQIVNVEDGTKYYESDQNRKHPMNTNTTPSVVTGANKTLNEVWVVVDADEANVSYTNTSFNYTGIDAGIYMLRELKAPTGYNKITNPVEFEVKATHTNDSTNPQFESLTVTKISGPIDFETGNGVISSNGTLTASVINKMGIMLPSTGGMGTTIFYIGGAALIVAAATLLIAKKRKISD